LIGDYVARSYEEAKGRPLYIVTDAFNMDVRENAIARAAILLGADSSLPRLTEEHEGESADVLARLGRRRAPWFR
jgi:hypothetical protein